MNPRKDRPILGFPACSLTPMAVGLLYKNRRLCLKELHASALFKKESPRKPSDSRGDGNKDTGETAGL